MLQVGLSAWIIQDGNYDDFEAGREYRFALAFHPDEIAVDQNLPSTPYLSPVSNALHDACGVILFASKSAWAVDFSVPAYQNMRPPAWAKIGASVKGRVYIGVDPFFYNDGLKDEKGMPDLFRQWFIRRILLETTPWKEATDAQGRKVRFRDATRESFKEVPATDAWNHDGGLGHYVLECEMR